MTRYLYSDGFREFGPFTIPELMQEKLRDDFMVRGENESEWQTLLSHPELQFLASNSVDAGTTNSGNSYRTSPTYRANAKSANVANWNDKVLFGTILLMVFLILFQAFLSFMSAQSGTDTIFGIFLITNFLYAFIPLLIALGIRKKNLRLIALLIAIGLTIYNIVQTGITYYTML